MDRKPTAHRCHASKGNPFAARTIPALGTRTIALLLALVSCLVNLAWTRPARAEVVRMEIFHRLPVAEGKRFGNAGPYELISGRLHYEVDPASPANGAIVDIERPPRNSAGRVEFASDFVLLRPLDPAGANGRLIYGVNNRGNLIMLNIFNDGAWSNAPVSAYELGNGFLLNEGYTLLWSGWNWDVVEDHGKLQIDLPVAQIGGRPVTGPVAAEMVTSFPRSHMAVAWGGSRGYPPLALGSPGDRLTVRQNPEDERELIPRKDWRFVTGQDGEPVIPVSIRLKTGFKPDLLYEAVYEAREARIVGLGLAAIRDTISFFRYASRDKTGARNPLVNDVTDKAPGKPPVSTALIYGFSQSARVIQQMLLQGFHVDEAGKPVFDAAFIHGPGGGKGSFNHRFAQTTRHPSQAEDHLYPADYFPFSTAQSRDPVSGRTASLLDGARKSGIVPKLLYLSASTEYWTRSASLLHTDVEGRSDLPPAENARIYSIAGTPHGVSLRPSRGNFENCHNPLDYRPLARALLTALAEWTVSGKRPPESVYPTLGENTLGPVSAYRSRFPKIPGVRLPEDNLKPPRLNHGPSFISDGIADIQPAKRGPEFTTLVPLPDDDGTDIGGIRLPEIVAPLGSHLGWNLRDMAKGGPRLGRWEGSFIPLRVTAGERRAASDPRLSLEERYPNRSAFLAMRAAAAGELVRRRLLLEGDVPQILERAARSYDALVDAKSFGSCAYLAGWR